MVEQAQPYISLSDNVTIKVPCTREGLKACYELSNDGILTNVTLVFSVSQAILAAKAGATYVSPFVGRVDDNPFGGLCLVKDIANTYKRHDVETQILAASIRNVRDVGRAFEYGANVCTIPVKVFDKMYDHVLAISFTRHRPPKELSSTLPTKGETYVAPALAASIACDTLKIKVTLTLILFSDNSLHARRPLGVQGTLIVAHLPNFLCLRR
jgi:transaldolase